MSVTTKVTSEYDTPGQLVVLLKGRAEQSGDQVMLQGLHILEMYFSALHDFSHDLARGTLKHRKDFSTELIGTYPLPKTDHWSRWYPRIARELDNMSLFLGQHKAELQ